MPAPPPPPHPLASPARRRWPVVPPSLRTPPRPENRAYLRALRAAEAAAWDAQVPPSPPQASPPKHPSPARSGDLLTLMLLTVAALGHVAWTVGRLAQP